MMKNTLLALVVLAGFAAAPRSASAAACATDLINCYGRAAGIDSFWYRTAAGLDCELDFTDCVRRKVIGR